MALPTSAEAIRLDSILTAVRSRWLDGTLGDTDTDVLWDALEAGLDQGSRATLRDIGSTHVDALRLMGERTRLPAVADAASAVYHHRDAADFGLPSEPLSTHWVESGSVAIPLRIQRTESPALVVTLHGVLPRARYQLPRFEWMNTLAPLGCNVLSFGDATMDLVPSMEGGWWLGTPTTDLIPRMAFLVQRVREVLGVEHLVFAGSSMGGFGALQLGGFIPDATVVAFNPQTDLRKYRVTHIARTAMGAAFGKDVDPEVDRVNVLHRYSTTGTTPARIRYVTNSGDEHHLHEHFEPFSAGLGAFSSTVLEQTWRDDGPGHVKAPPKAFRTIIAEEIDRAMRH